MKVNCVNQVDSNYRNEMSKTREPRLKDLFVGLFLIDACMCDKSNECGALVSLPTPHEIRRDVYKENSEIPTTKNYGH